jgi:nitrate/TMAO reductase-like tetraheme cytochrome c subunit
MTESSSKNPVEPTSETPKRPRRHWLKRLFIMGGICLIMLALLAGGMEYYTSRPNFCGSCHIMVPYYDSWSDDVHSDAGEALCVDCHYAPGERHTLMAKFKGLSQATSYFSGRAGGGRPKAHVNDASCLTSNCHGDREFMKAPLKLGNVTFVHTDHLDPEQALLAEKRKQLVERRASLANELSNAQLSTLERLAGAMWLSDQRNAELMAWLDRQGLNDKRDDVLAFAELVHTELRIEQLSGLNCANCHEFDASLDNHFLVAKTTCYTCHFTNQPFNVGTGACLTCHEPPTTQIEIHPARGSRTTGTTETDTQPVVMDHAVVVENNVNCISCHADLIHGSGQVTRRDCQNCHDQDRFLQDWDQRTTKVVGHYHRVHAAGQRARCNDCHRVIDHKLIPLGDLQDAFALLAPVRQDCQHCHPDHHQEQMKLLIGEGGFTETGEVLPNQMVGSRATCSACHTEPGTGSKEQAVITGTVSSCRACHGDEYQELFGEWQDSIAARLREAESLRDNVQQRLAAASKPYDRDQLEADRLSRQAQQNIHLVAAGNGIHNKNYALVLLDQAVTDLERCQRILAGSIQR